MKIRNLFIFLAPLILLAACSGAPNESNIKNAISTKMEQFLASKLNNPVVGRVLKKRLGISSPEDISIKITNFESKNLHQLDNGNWRLRTTFTAVTGGRKKTSSAQLTLSKLNGKWKIVGMNK